jgi:hypothetical protein
VPLRPECAAIASDLPRTTRRRCETTRDLAVITSDLGEVARNLAEVARDHREVGNNLAAIVGDLLSSAPGAEAVEHGGEAIEEDLARLRVGRLDVTPGRRDSEAAPSLTVRARRRGEAAMRCPPWLWLPSAMLRATELSASRSWSPSSRSSRRIRATTGRSVSMAAMMVSRASKRVRCVVLSFMPPQAEDS